MRRTDINLDDISTKELLEVKLKDLPISIKKSLYLKPAIKQVQLELDKRSLKMKPTFWLSTEWFCPNGYLGIAIPFYLAHPRLMELEREMTGAVEGEGLDWTLKLLRHELGHVVDNAFFLRREKERREIFGNSSKSYPLYYDHRPYSKSFVRHLEGGYAQGHPAEDFAETFAVWLDPKSNWKKAYESWPALIKLNYVDQRMKRLAGVLPSQMQSDFIEPISENNMTLGQHYKKRRRYMRIEDSFWSDFPSTRLKDEDLIKLRTLISERYLLPRYKADRILSSYKNRQQADIKRIPSTISSARFQNLFLKKAEQFFEQKRDHQPL